MLLWGVGLVRLFSNKVRLAYVPGIIACGLGTMLFCTLFLPRSAYENYSNGEWLMGIPFFAGIEIAGGVGMLTVSASVHAILVTRKRGASSHRESN